MEERERCYSFVISRTPHQELMMPRLQIPQSNEGRHWFSYVDRTVTTELLERLTSEFLHIFDKCPSRLKRKMMSMTSNSEY
jgi:cyclin T